MRSAIRSCTGTSWREAYNVAIARGTTIDAAILELASKNGLAIKTIKADDGLLEGRVFFEKYASKPVGIYDTPLKGGQHGALTHIVQDLVVDRALKAKGHTSFSFRSLLGQAEGKKLITDLDGKRILASIGDIVWRNTYDLYKLGHLPMPKMSGSVLRKFLKVQ